MILFLDFDGVLHPDEVWLTNGRLKLEGDGHLFMWAGLLADVLNDFPSIQIVLSTSWARQFGYSRAKKHLPPGLRNRVIGATWHSSMGKQDGLNRPHAVTWWDAATRYEQIKRYAVRAKQTDWIAIDDQPEGWRADDRDKLVQTNSDTGLSDPAMVALLVSHLQSKLVFCTSRVTSLRGTR